MKSLALLDHWLPADGTTGDFLLCAVGLSVLVLLMFAVAVGLFVLLSYLFSLPMQRRERTRLFLDLIESGLRRGHSVEHTIVNVARSGDRSLGRRFQRLAGLIESGLRFGDALAIETAFLPRETAGLLRAGCDAGDLSRILPACREPLRDGVSEVAKAHHYFVLLAFVVTPTWITVFGGFAVFIAPKLEAIAADMGATMPELFGLMMRHYHWLIAGHVALLGFLWTTTALYVGGPRLRRWLDDIVPSVGSWFAIRIPWRRQRMQRDFSAALAALLDAGVPEARALRVAAGAAGNDHFTTRASQVIDELARGVALPTAVQCLDDTGELRWRLVNALRSRGRFSEALAGWHQALEARAFHGEQAFAQIATTGLVFVNGASVLALGVVLFSMFTSLINEGALW